MSHAQDTEKELKLVPVDPELLSRLAVLPSLGELQVKGRRHEVQHNSFFDTASHGLSRAGLGFRRRTLPGEKLAAWTLKADGKVARGVATRTEIELKLDADMPAALALGALRDAAQSRGAQPLAESVADVLAAEGLPLAQPFVETHTDRTILDLESPSRGWEVELALDRVQLLGHDVAEIEIEAELKRGDESALEAARAGIEAFGQVRESEASKLSRAMAHLQVCHCAGVSHLAPSSPPRQKL